MKTIQKTIQPFGDRVLIKASEPRQQTASGIYLPDTSRGGPGEGEIIAIREGSPLHEKLSVGGKILYQRLGGTEINLDGTTYLLLGEADILGLVVELDQLPGAPAPETAVAVA